MAIVVNMPRLSDTMEEGVVAKWLKNIGDKIEEGDILAEIETDKATMEFESFNEGTLLYIGVQEGETAPVDTLLAIIGDEGEDFSNLLNNQESEKEEESIEKTEEEVNEIKIPDAIKVITMPRLSDTMTEGTVAAWLKKVGDKIEEGDILAEIETDKATMEFESFNEGTLLYIGVQEGESAPVDSLLAIIGKEGIDVASIVDSLKKEQTIEKSVEEKKEKTTNLIVKEETVPTVTSNTNNSRVFASPLAKKIAKERGINLSDVKGSGENGRIIKKDVENYMPSVRVDSTQQTTSEKQPVAMNNFITTGKEAIEDVKNSQMRKVIAKRLGESKFTAPHYYLTIEVNMDNAITSRKMINAIPETKVSFNDMIVKASAMALKRHPQVNTSWLGDSTRYNKHIHVGVAVAVEEGLLVPVLKFTDQMSLTQIGSKVKELASKARNKKIAPNEMEGSTFTISNLGMFGIQEFTSIINQPNSAILSVGAIVEKPVVKNGELAVGNTMKLTLACDHRTVDGATGAQFLQTLKLYIENPVTMLA